MGVVRPSPGEGRAECIEQEAPGFSPRYFEFAVFPIVPGVALAARAAFDAPGPDGRSL